MYQRLLVPVDGSDLSDRAIRESIALARQLGASIIGFVAEPDATRATAAVSPLSVLRPRSEDDDDLLAPAQARAVLDQFAERAREAGVPFTGHHARVPRVDRAILDEAEARGCDLIVMATHGRGAFGEFLYGSQTKAVLSSSRLPLLVLH